MKKEWMEPVVEVQEFAANEYVAACGDSGKVYKFVCDAGQYGHNYNVYYYDGQGRGMGRAVRHPGRLHR